MSAKKYYTVDPGPSSMNFEIRPTTAQDGSMGQTLDVLKKSLVQFAKENARTYLRNWRKEMNVRKRKLDKRNPIEILP